MYTFSADKEKDQFWWGTIFGMVVTFLVSVSMSRIMDKDVTQRVELPQDIISSYNMGIKDALRTNPASQDLEHACLEMWSNKQR